MVDVVEVAPWLMGLLVLAGAGVLVTRRRELFLRWCIWVVAVPVVLALFWWGEPGIALLAGGAVVVTATELGRMLALPAVDRGVLLVALLALVLAVWLRPDLATTVLGTGALALAAAPVLTGDAERGLHRLTAGLLGLVWLAPLAGMVSLGTTALALFVAVSVADVTAFFAGPRLGGPRLSPLSPGKRWSGTLVGSAAGVLALAALGALTWPTADAVAIGGPAGDLLESMVKRGARVKDSGAMMAGAGGLLDRIDSLLLALAVALLLG